jgi:carboxymethylenebutenolidase
MNHLQRYLAEEFVEDYAEGRLSRRQALKLIASITGSLLLAEGFLAACTPSPEATATLGATSAATSAPNTAAAGSAMPAASEAATDGATKAATEPAAATQTSTPEDDNDLPDLAGTAAAVGTVMPDDPDVAAGPVEFPGVDATLRGYLARPAAGGPHPVVLVCHENRGLTAHIEDVTRRVAKAGYVGLAVDLLSRAGGTAAVGSDNVPGALSGMQPDQFVQDFRSGWEHTATLPEADAPRLGMVGFCFGGGITWQVATHLPELRAAVPFYGPQPPVEDVPNIEAAVLAIYGELDSRINGGIAAIEAAMQANGKTFEKQIYAGADHAFHNDTSSRYNAEAARDAWARSLAWFGKYL